MRWSVLVNGAPRDIEILAPAPDCRFRLDGAERQASVESAAPGIYSVILDGRSYDVWLERTERGPIVTIDGCHFEIEVRDPRRWSRKAGTASSDGIAALIAPMPGKVVRVLAAAGDTVEAGQGIMVVEAMKMQNEMKASRTGRLLSVSVQEGATVAAGEVLATIG